MLFRHIQSLCAEKKLTFSQLEREAKLSNGSIRKWETSIPSADKVLAVAKYFGVSVDYLLTGKALDYPIPMLNY